MARVVAGRYELEVPLGRGASGEVWRGKEISTRRPVAVKLVELTEIDNPVQVAETIARFRREAATLARLKHPNIISALEAGRLGNELFLVMELAEGISLAAMVSQRAATGLGMFPVASVLQIAEQACSGLGAAHAAGVVHRDIKPSNLMVGTRLHITIIDFGIARLLTENSPRLTQPSQAIGTLSYMSPEQLRAGDIDGRSDLYSLGCVLYELLAGRPPFTANSQSALMMMQLQQRAQPLDSVRPDLPEGLSQLVDQMMEKDPGARPDDASRVLARLGAIANRLDRSQPVQEADRATVSRATILNAGRGGASGGPPRREVTAEGARSTSLTPERLADLSTPWGASPAAAHRATEAAAGSYRPTEAALPQDRAGYRPTEYGGHGPASPAASLGAAAPMRPAGPAPQPFPAGPPGGGSDRQPSWPDPAKARGPAPRPRPRRWRSIVSSLITAAIVIGIAAYVWQRTHPSLAVTGVSVALASPLGTKCDATAQLVGTIVTNAKGGPITYQWVEDSTPLSAATVTAGSGQDTVQVTLKWTFQGKGTKNATAELRVISPGSQVGNTQFTYSCA